MLEAIKKTTTYDQTIWNYPDKADLQTVGMKKQPNLKLSYHRARRTVLPSFFSETFLTVKAQVIEFSLIWPNFTLSVLYSLV